MIVIIMNEVVYRVKPVFHAMGVSVRLSETGVWIIANERV
jgi:hypothetical protein